MSRRSKLETSNASLAETIRILSLHNSSDSQVEQTVTNRHECGVALAAIALMLDDKAACLAVEQGEDVTEYIRLTKAAHRYRSLAGQFGTDFDADAAALYDEVAT